jgi:hypothetical protein
VPDNFPTLEVVAALGLCIALLRTIRVLRSLVKIPQVNQQLAALLDKGERDSALKLCAEDDAAAFLQMARRVLLEVRQHTATEETEALRHRLMQVFDREYAVQAERIQSGRARDTVALAVLLGAIAYATVARLGVGTVFFALCAAGALFLAWNVWVRGRVLSESRQAAPSLVDAAVRLVRRAPPPAARQRQTRAHCPSCGGELSASGSGELSLGGATAAVAGIVVCRKCGHVEGKLGDPAALG